MTIRVGLIAPYAYRLFHPDDDRILPFGGAEVQQYQLGKELSKDRDFAVSFLVGDFFQQQPKVEEVTIEGNIVRIYKTIVCRDRNVLIDGLADFGKLFTAMKQASADVYLIRGGGSLAGKVAFLARMLRKKFIYSSAHDRDSNLDFVHTHAPAISWLFRYAVRHADQIICQHQDQQKAFAANFGRQTTVIKSMYAIEPPPHSAVKRQYVLWVSRLEDWKRPKLFVDLAKRFPVEKFLLITNSDATDFRNKFGHTGNLEIKERIPLEEMDQYFRQAKVFVNTSRQEGFPNTFVQAAKNQTPIASLQVDPEGMLTKCQMGRCANGNFEKLVDDLKEILNNQRLWSTMSENAYQYAKQNHDIKRIVAEYQNVFRRLRPEQ